MVRGLQDGIKNIAIFSISDEQSHTNVSLFIFFFLFQNLDVLFT